jgi:hypothetical protein
MKRYAFLAAVAALAVTGLVIGRVVDGRSQTEASATVTPAGTGVPVPFRPGLISITPPPPSVVSQTIPPPLRPSPTMPVVLSPGVLALPTMEPYPPGSYVPQQGDPCGALKRAEGHQGVPDHS